MTSEFYALLADHDYEQGGTVNPISLTEKIDAFRRLLENQIQLSQIGPGIFTFNANEKEQAFKAVDALEQWASYNQLVFGFIQFAPLEKEFKNWQHKQP